MPGEEKRRSSRVVPVVSEEEVVLIDLGGNMPRPLAKLLDFSEVGTLVYLLVEADLEAVIGSPCSLMLYHQGKVFTVPAKIVRKLGRLIGFDFANVEPGILHDIQTKLLRMEVEWLRLSKR